MASEETQNAVAIKLPTFWTAQARVWFRQAEAQFAIKGVKDDLTKYYYVVSALDQHTATRLLDLLDQPPDVNKYQSIKHRLLTTFSLTCSQRASALLDMAPLGDRIPSALMDEMLALLGDHTPCFLFRELFLRHMPAEVRTGLAGKDFETNRDLAQQADALFLAARENTSQLSISKLQRQTPRSILKPLREQSVICFYHRRFKDKAHRCIPPCSFSQGNWQADHV